MACNSSPPSLEVHNLPANAPTSGRQLQQVAASQRETLTRLVKAGLSCPLFVPPQPQIRFTTKPYTFESTQRDGVFFYDRVARRLPQAPTHVPYVVYEHCSTNYATDVEMTFLAEYIIDMGSQPDTIQDDARIRKYLTDTFTYRVVPYLPRIFQWYYTYEFVMPARATYDVTATRLHCMRLLHRQIITLMTAPRYSEVAMRHLPTPADTVLRPKATVVLQQVYQAPMPVLDPVNTVVHQLRDGTPVTKEAVARAEAAHREPTGGSTRIKYRPRDRTGRRYLEHAAAVPQDGGVSHKRKEVVVTLRSKLSAFGTVVEFGKRFNLANDGHVARLLDCYVAYWNSIYARVRQSSIRKDVAFCDWYRGHEHRPVFTKLLQLLGNKTAAYIQRVMRMQATPRERRDFHLVPQMESGGGRARPLEYEESGLPSTMPTWGGRFKLALARGVLHTLKGAVNLLDTAYSGAARTKEVVSALLGKVQHPLEELHDGASTTAAAFRAAVVRAFEFIRLPVDFISGGVAKIYDSMTELIGRLVGDRMGKLLTSVVGVTIIAILSLALLLVLLAVVCKKMLPSVWKALWSGLGSVVNGMGLTRVYDHFFGAAQDDLQPQIGSPLTEGGFFSFATGLFSKAAQKAPVVWHSVGDTLPRWKRIGDAVEWFANRIPKWWAWCVSWFTGVPVPISSEEEEVHTLHIEITAFSAMVAAQGGCVTAFNQDPQRAVTALALCERHMAMLRRYGPGGSRITPAFVLILRNDQASVDILRKGVLSHKAAASVRNVPIWLHISGENNQGKSTFVEKLLPRLKATLAAIHPDDVRYTTPYSSADVYALRPRDGFWDNYTGQPFVIADDLFQVNDEKERAQLASDFMTIIGPQTCPLMVADPAHKGVTYFTSDFIITTGNTANINAVGITTPAGLWQRQYMHLKMVAHTFRFQPIWNQMPRYYKTVDGKRVRITEPTEEDIVGILASRCVESYRQARLPPNLTPVEGIYQGVTPRFRSFDEKLDRVQNFRYAAGDLKPQSGKMEQSDSSDDSDSDEDEDDGQDVVEEMNAAVAAAILYSEKNGKPTVLPEDYDHYSRPVAAVRDFLVTKGLLDRDIVDLFLRNMPNRDRVCAAHSAHSDSRVALSEREMNEAYAYCREFRGGFVNWVYTFLGNEPDDISVGWSPFLLWRTMKRCRVDFALCQFPRRGSTGVAAAYHRYVTKFSDGSPLTYQEFVHWGFNWQRIALLTDCAVGLSLGVLVGGLIGAAVHLLCKDWGFSGELNAQSGAFAGNIKKRERVFPRHLPNLAPRIVGRTIQPQAKFDDWLVKCMLNSRQITIQHPTGKNDTFYGLGVFGNVMLVARHCSDAFVDGDALVLNAGFDGAAQVYQHEQTAIIELGSACDHEVTFLVLPTMQNHFPNIIKHFTNTVRESGVVVRGRRTPVQGQIVSEVVSSKAFQVLPDDIVDGQYTKHARGGGLLVHGMDNAEGYCGLPYFHPQSSDGSAILGIHVAGNVSSRVNSVARVSRHMVQAAYDAWKAHYASPLGDPIPRDDLKLELDEQIARVPGVQVLGSLPKEYIARLPKRSRLLRTDLHPDSPQHDPLIDMQHQPVRVPCSSVPYEVAGEIINPLRLQLRKWGELKGEANVGGVWLDEWTLLADTSKLLPPGYDSSACRLLTVQEAIDGCDGVEGMDMTTSSGFPHNLQGRNRRAVLHVDNKPSPVFCADVLALEKALEEGPRPMVVIDYPKDELIPKDDYAKGKCRLFCAGELSYVALTRMYFATMLLEMEKVPHATPISIGINPHSSQWAYLYQRLSKHPNVGAGDFSGQEFTIPHTMAPAFADFCEFAFPLPPRETRVRRHLIMSIIHVIHLIFGIAFALQRGEGSGHPLTAFFNSFCTWYFFVAAWINMGKPPEEFYRHVELAVMGDDSVVTVSDAHKDFNMFAWADFANLIGMHYTPASKGAITQAFQRWGEVDYLKRRFVVRDSWVFAPLAWSSIMEMPMWVKDNAVDREDDILSSFMSMRDELRHYPRSQYDYYNAVALRWAKKHHRTWNLIPWKVAVALMSLA